MDQDQILLFGKELTLSKKIIFASSKLKKFADQSSPKEEENAVGKG